MTTAFRMHDALTKAGLEYSALSWGGFNLFGDRASIEEAERIKHNSDILPAIRDQLVDACQLAHEWMSKHDKLLGFIQERPALLKELIAETTLTSALPPQGSD
jgi:hypothetical protein